MNRRSLLKRAGALGLSIPAAGMILQACGGEASPAASGDTTSFAVASSNPQTAPEVVELTVVAKDIYFEPAELSAPAGSLVRLTFVNEGVMEHDWQMPGLKSSVVSVITPTETTTARMDSELAAAETGSYPYAGAAAGGQMVIEFMADTPGAYEYLCVVPGHKEAGMVGTFTVIGDAVAESAPAHHDEHTDPHMAGAPSVSSGTPYDAPRLPNPVVAPPVGNREPQLIKQEIEIREVVGYVDEGVAFTFWTFDGTVPGPMIRARVGDTVELTLTNPADSHATHNIDLHAVTGPGGGAEATLIAPGQSATFRWKALHPGVYVYHCATAPIPQHISAGMYGLVVIEPEGGLEPVDHEFYVMQGDLYLEGARGEKGLRGFSIDKMLDERPDYVLFNGAVGAIAGERAFKAKVGDRIRIFFGVGGPNLTSSFHIIGEIFDRVAIEGGSQWNYDVQTTLVPAGGATIIEFTADVPSTLMMVDHSLGRAMKGCAGMIEIEGDENPEVFEIVQEAH